MDKLLDLTRDFDAAKAAFEAYLDEYDRADDKIHLKIVHTYGVVDAAEDIARRMGLGEEDVQLAKVIVLLHDIALRVRSTVISNWKGLRTREPCFMQN